MMNRSFVVTVLVLVAGGTGYHFGHRVAQAVGQAALSDLQRQYAEASRAAMGEARAKERELTAYADHLSERLSAERAQHAQQANQLKRSMAHVTRQYRSALDAPLQPLPQCVFTRGCVGVWNTAIGVGVGRVSSASAALSLADAPDAADTLDSGVQLADLLAHHVDDGQRCRGIEAQLNRVLDWIEGDKS